MRDKIILPHYGRKPKIPIKRFLGMVEFDESKIDNFNDNINFNQRIEMIKFYDSKVNANLLRLITVSLAIIGFQSGELIQVFGKPDPLWLLGFRAFMLAALITAVFYFLGRALYWSIIGSILCSVRGFSRKWVEDSFPVWAGEKSRFSYSEFTGLNEAAKYRCSQIKEWLPRTVFKLFDNNNRFVLSVAFFIFSLLIILLLQCNFKPFTNTA